MKVVLLNAGSSSLKATLAESTDGTTLASGLTDWAGSATRYKYVCGAGSAHSEEVPWKGHAEAVNRFMLDLTTREPIVLADRSDLDGIGHRVVHGGPFTSSVRIGLEVRARIAALAELAPLHNPPSLEALAAAETLMPEVPQVAVFDTAFHATLSPEAFTYAVPAKWTRDWGIRRFGFHGLSHAYCSRRAAEMLGRPADQLRLVICHLGHGCSATAVLGGQSIDTTMGFTPLEGLMMGTRSGSIDPGIVPYVQQQHGLTSEQIETTLNTESGLLGVSEISADMRQVLAAAHDGHGPSQLAVAVYSRRVRQAIGALVVTLGGVDALVFTAGVGEHAAEVREAICTGLECIGVDLDQGANRACTADAEVAKPTSRGRILVIATREDLMMLQEVVRVLEKGSVRP
jgi:acetate kinase